MKDTSILIPTVNRPGLLITALESVARQQGVERIGEIFVFENGLNRSSKEVCEKFPALPIKYIFRDPPVPLSKLTVANFTGPQLPYVAMLHDDDWWMPFHLERSLAQLDKEPGIAAVYSSHFITESETAWFRNINGNFTAWFGNQEKYNAETRKLDFTQTLITSILQAGFHMSSLVARKTAIEGCFPAFQDGNEYDNDRTLAVELARQGGLLFFDAPSVAVRTHPNQDSRHASKDGRAARWFTNNTERLIKQAQSASIDISAELLQRIQRTDFGPKMVFKKIPPRDFKVLVRHSLLPKQLYGEYRKSKFLENFWNALFYVRSL
jgi:glycosyltransferase involved in cell wall biosynthesis